MSRHIFAKIEERRMPIVGDLIRATRNSPDFINIVLAVSPIQRSARGNFVWIRSVRYGTTNNCDFRLLNGQRSRAFRYILGDRGYNDWDIVEEYVLAGNELARMTIVNRLKDVDTAWRDPNEDVEGLDQEHDDGDIEGT